MHSHARYFLFFQNKNKPKVTLWIYSSILWLFFFFFLTNVPGIVLLTGDSRMTKLFGIWKGVQIINQAVTH